ncbi:MAG: CRISPR-associated protein Cas4 [Isosphaera sp.]|nr:CRISPR-associated protein Cas4 [Isosphaera sp.]
MTPLPVLPPDPDGYPPLSALNDLLFCERRCFLHRVEGVWVENHHTAAGTLDHRRVHRPRDADAGGTRTARGLWIVSHRLRVVGVCDLVEFRPDPAGGPDVPFPVEYKRGRRRRWDNNEVQLCAQAVALEEVLKVPVPAGALYFVKTRRRQEVAFDARLRDRTADAAARLHALLAARTAPPPVVHPKCRQCSLHAACLPDLVAAPAAYRRAAANLFRPT